MKSIQFIEKDTFLSAPFDAVRPCAQEIGRSYRAIWRSKAGQSAQTPVTTLCASNVQRKAGAAGAVAWVASDVELVLSSMEIQRFELVSRNRAPTCVCADLSLFVADRIGVCSDPLNMILGSSSVAFRGSNTRSGVPLEDGERRGQPTDPGHPG